jgi:hypothetical protein
MFCIREVVDPIQRRLATGHRSVNWCLDVNVRRPVLLICVVVVVVVIVVVLLLADLGGTGIGLFLAQFNSIQAAV